MHSVMPTRDFAPCTSLYCAGIDASGSTHLVRGDADSLFAYAIGDSDASRKWSAFEDDA
jgi:hypothetical protein